MVAKRSHLSNLSLLLQVYEGESDGDKVIQADGISHALANSTCSLLGRSFPFLWQFGLNCEISHDSSKEVFINLCSLLLCLYLQACSVNHCMGKTPKVLPENVDVDLLIHSKNFWVAILQVCLC